MVIFLVSLGGVFINWLMTAVWVRHFPVSTLGEIARSAMAEPGTKGHRDKDARSWSFFSMICIILLFPVTWAVAICWFSTKGAAQLWSKLAFPPDPPPPSSKEEESGAYRSKGQIDEEEEEDQDF